MKQEKVSFENSEGKRLAGILHIPEQETKKIVIIAHGFTMHKRREHYIEIADKLHENDIALLRFDFGGSGESYDTEIDLDKQVDDLNSAIKFVKDRGYNEIGLIGESLGGLACLKANLQEVKTAVLLAPGIHSKVPTYIKRHPEKKVMLDEKGFVEKEKDGKTFILPKKYFDDRLNVNQEELVKELSIPVLILHGDNDGIVPLEHSEGARDKNKNIKLEIIENAGHDVGEEKEAQIKIINWFKEELK